MCLKNKKAIEPVCTAEPKPFFVWEIVYKDVVIIADKTKNKQYKRTVVAPDKDKALLEFAYRYGFGNIVDIRKIKASEIIKKVSK